MPTANPAANPAAAPSPGVILCVKSATARFDPRLEDVLEQHGQQAVDKLNISSVKAFFLGPAPGACREALRIAEDLLQEVDRVNLRASGSRIHLKVAATMGELNPKRPFDSAAYDEAEKLCERGPADEVLVSGEVKRSSDLPQHRFKGLPGLPSFLFRVERLLKSEPVDFQRNGLVALYPDRSTLSRALTPARLLDLAGKDSVVLVAGRTLLSWASLVAEMRYAATTKNVAFRFLLSLPDSCEILSPREQEEIRRDSPRVRGVFEELVTPDRKPFDIRETDQAVVDGVTCVSVLLPGEKDPNRRTLLVIQDINAAPGAAKAALVFACSEADEACKCMAHGLYRRTCHRLDQAKPLPAALHSAVEQMARRSEGLPLRRNRPTDYAGRLGPYFEAYAALEKHEPVNFPPPLCVQLQITDVCSTNCVMCDHHREQREGLQTEAWEAIFKDLAGFGVRSCIFSGGEPLMQRDLARLLYSAKEQPLMAGAHGAKSQALEIGLLTNGMAAGDEPSSLPALLEAIHRCVSWVAVSIDGIPEEDYTIRRPKVDEDERIRRLKAFCDYFRRRRSPEDYARFLSATVTLQRANIRTDLRALCQFIHKEFGISQINFKLATGNRSALSKEPEFLPKREDLESLRRFLWHSALPGEPGNNLAYLRRCLAQEVFTLEDVANGAPLLRYYNEQAPPLRCFAPVLFALIDVDGTVYPCCHLYRDNHGADPSSAGFRSRHALGNVARASFASIWKGEKYDFKRKQLTGIRPAGDFTPCGECTRFCQHNLALNVLYREFRENPAVLNSFGSSSEPVWL
jgi:pyruvate-formate lyase-activating enzyme